LSDTSVGDELTVVDQVARSMAGQGLVDKHAGFVNYVSGEGRGNSGVMCRQTAVIIGWQKIYVFT